MVRLVFVTFLVLAVASVSLAQAVLVSNEAGITPSQYYSDTQVTYTITLKGVDKTTLSIDGGTGAVFSETTSVTLDGSKPHQFQVPQAICQSGWECGDQVTDWRKGMRLSVNQWTWTVPAGTVKTYTYTETYFEQYYVCVSYDIHGTCVSGYYVNQPYAQAYTQSSFTPPCNPCQFTFEYTQQFRLVIEDKHSYRGSWVYGWYNAGSVAQFPSLDHLDPFEGPPAGVRDVFNGWAIDDSNSKAIQAVMSAPHKATATYLTQYHLDVTSQCTGFHPNGGGWYGAGQIATISVENQVPQQGWLGLLGGKYVFNYWSGSTGVTIDKSTSQVVMNQPQTYTATCRADHTIPAVILIPAITITAGCCGFYYYFYDSLHRKRKHWWGTIFGRKGTGRFGRNTGRAWGRTAGGGSLVYDKDGNLIAGPTRYDQPSTPPGTTGEAPSPIMPGGQSTGGVGIQQGQSNPPTQWGRPVRLGRPVLGQRQILLSAIILGVSILTLAYLAYPTPTVIPFASTNTVAIPSWNTWTTTAVATRASYLALTTTGNVYTYSTFGTYSGEVTYPILYYYYTTLTETSTTGTTVAVLTVTSTTSALTSYESKNIVNSASTKSIALYQSLAWNYAVVVVVVLALCGAAITTVLMRTRPAGMKGEIRSEVRSGH
jgi:hypothetical protein